MHIKPTPIDGVMVIDLDRREDARGFFARLACARAFAEHGLSADFVQVNTSMSREAGTLRGIHYQLPPAAEDKLVRCIAGALWDVALDLRPQSATFGRWHGVELSADNRRMLYLPKGCGHAFLTLAPDTEALYFVTAFYAPERERGIRWDDPRFGIDWPSPPAVLSPKDRDRPDFDPAVHLATAA